MLKQLSKQSTKLPIRQTSSRAIGSILEAIRQETQNMNDTSHSITNHSENVIHGAQEMTLIHVTVEKLDSDSQALGKLLCQFIVEA